MKLSNPVPTRMHVQDIAKLEKLAKKLGLSLSATIRYIVSEYLKR